MFKKLLCIGLFLFIECNATLTCPKAEISVNARDDSFKWNSAGIDRDPNVASELKWTGLRSFGGGGSVGALFFSQFPVEIKGSYNKIYAGTNEDSDYFGENKTGLFLKSVSDASKGELFDVSAEVGMIFSCVKNISLTPHIGYSLNEQHLKEFDGFTEFNFFEPEKIGPIEGLNSSYDARWQGPYLGLKAHWPLFQGTFGIGFDYYFSAYRAKGIANLRPDIIGPFIHRAHGWGKEFFAEFQSRIQDKLFFEVKLKFGKFWTKRGVESGTIQGDTGQLVPIKVDVNHVEWKNRSISAHLIKRF